MYKINRKEKGYPDAGIEKKWFEIWQRVYWQDWCRQPIS